MESVGGCVNSRCSRESAQTHRHTQAADGNDGGTGALQQSKHDPRPIQELGIYGRHPWARRFRAFLRAICWVLHLFRRGRNHLALLRMAASILDKWRREVEG